MPGESLFPATQGCIPCPRALQMSGMITSVHCSWLQLLPSLPLTKHTKAAPLFLTFPFPPPPPPKQVCPPQPPAAAQVHCCHPPGRRQRTGRARAAPAHQGMEKLIKGSIRSGANGAHHSCVCI